MEHSESAIRNDVSRSRFVLDVDGSEAELIYRRRAARLVLIHTEVPPAFAGRGIGGRLVRAALNHARAENLTIVPWCPYARKWITDHPDEAAGTSIDWDTLPDGGGVTG